VAAVIPEGDVRIVPRPSHTDVLHVPAAIDAIAAAFKENMPRN
jgi:hypothetical protein